MEKSHTTASAWRAAATTSLLALMVLALGCGSDDEYKNNPRPPAPINVTAFISPQKVSVSPAHFGAGPIIVIVTNHSDSSQEATFETDEFGGEGGVTQSTGPINPGDTGQIKLDVTEGTYRVRVGNGSIRPAVVEVGGERESAQNEVLQP